MRTALLMSMLLATIVIPFRNARLADEALGLRKTIRQVVIAAILWGIAAAYVVPALPK